MSDLELQRRVTRIALEASASGGFALAGSGAIREHGIISRLSEDVDLFTSNTNELAFGGAVDHIVDALTRAGFDIGIGRRSASFARLYVRTGDNRQVDVDLGMDWRETDPVALEVGPVLSIQDAIGNKVSALYSRAEPRDFFDVDAIRASGHFTDAQLIEAALERDPGFEAAMFAVQLRRADRLHVDDLSEYGVDGSELQALKERFAAWAVGL